VYLLFFIASHPPLLALSFVSTHHSSPTRPPSRHPPRSPAGTRLPEVDALFALYRRLNALCEERAERGTDPGAAAVQDVLRYRLTRLVTGDAWDSHPSLRLRVLRLIHGLSAAEHERLAEAGRGAPTIKLGRALSLGRARSRDLGPRRRSKWEDALAEVGRLPGARLMPLVRLMLLEGSAAEAAAYAAAGGAAPPKAASGNLEDLLGMEAPAPGGAEAANPRAPSPPSPAQSAPAPAPTPAAGADPFAALAGAREGAASAGGGASRAAAAMAGMSLASAPPSSGGWAPPRAGSPAGSVASHRTCASSVAQSAPQQQLHSAPVPAPAPLAPQALFQQGSSGSSGAYACSPNFQAPPPAPDPYGSYGRPHGAGARGFHAPSPQGSLRGGGGSGSLPATPPQLGSGAASGGDHALASVAAFEAAFDAASPYKDSPAPLDQLTGAGQFAVHPFGDLDPVHARP
jgi:hypothetical protein